MSDRDMHLFPFFASIAALMMLLRCDLWDLLAVVFGVPLLLAIAVIYPTFIGAVYSWTAYAAIFVYRIIWFVIERASSVTVGVDLIIMVPTFVLAAICWADDSWWRAGHMPKMLKRREKR